MFGLDEIVEQNKRATETKDHTATGTQWPWKPETEFEQLVDKLDRPEFPKAPPKIEWGEITYQITIPGIAPGAGALKDFTRGNEIMEWEAFVYSVAGGFSLVTADSFGYWNDPVGHQTYVDHNRIYNVCVGADGFKAIMDKAVEVFKDEKAIFAIQLGRCVTFTRT